MEKLDLQIFRSLKQEVVEYIEKYKEAEERGEYLSDEEQQQFLARYKEIIEILSEHDLSDIDFEEWRGMILFAEEDFPLDFSKTKANIDFSILEDFSAYDIFPNFKSCQIKKFDFKKYNYSPEMFDEEFRKENEGRFLSENIPEEVSDRFYKGELTLTDIQNYPELAIKIEEKNLAYGLRDIYKIIGREEFCKLDAQFVDRTSHKWIELLNSNPNLRTAEEIMPVLYKSAREQIIGYDIAFYYTQDQLGERFREENPDLFLSDEVPEIIRSRYYNHQLSLQDFSDYLKYFEGKTVVQALQSFSLHDHKIVSLYGNDIYQLYTDYQPIIQRMRSDFYVMSSMELAVGPVTYEQRKEIMGRAIHQYLIRNGYDQANWDEFKMILDFIPIESLPASYETKTFIAKYGLDKIIESGLSIACLFRDEKITSLEELIRLKEIGIDDIENLIPDEQKMVIATYGVKQLLEYGITDLSELSKITNDLNQIREMLQERPLDLINMGKYGYEKKRFIERYGIDNIITLDKETKGMFSHQLWQDDVYMTVFALAEKSILNLESNEQLTYEQFRDRMYEILLHARDESGILTSGDCQDYDFIQGKFREEHQDIFLDGEFPENVKKAFYTRHMTAEMIRQNPELIKLMQGKDLSRAFDKKMIAGLSMTMQDKDGNAIGGLPNTVNMAEYLSKELGQEEFLKICADYGKCLDSIVIMTKGEISVESVRETIEQAIFKEIKEKGIEYFEDLPLSFQEKHSELFLPKEVDEELRSKFYSGKLSFEDIRQNPQIKQLLLTKDISVGFGRTKYGQPMLGGNGQRYVNSMWEVLSEQEILDFAERYGKYFLDIDVGVFKDGQSSTERDKAVQDNIEERILNENTRYDDTAPEFFYAKHPELFLSEDALEELKLYFYNGYTSQAEGFLNHSSSNYLLDFKKLNEHPEWREFLQGKDLTRAFQRSYRELFKRFDSPTLMKFGTRNPETIEKMVQNHKEDVLENWYKSTGGKFVPHHVVMLNFPEGEIDSFLGNSKRWSQLMRIDNYNLNDDGKAAILKASYTMGVFQGDDDGFNKTMKLFTDIPQELTQEEYDKVINMLNSRMRSFKTDSIISDPKIEEMINLFENTYNLNEEGKYICGLDKQKNKDKVKEIRQMLEEANIKRILTPEKAHQIFDSFAMEYNPDFVRFFNGNIEEILSNPEYTKDIATIQRQFKDIVRTNAGRRLTLDVAQDYIRSIAYTDIEVGNEGVAEQAKIAGYSQKDFEAIQSLFNEGEVRDFSSIPRIQGSTKGYTYEMLKLDDPLALTIGTLTDCCQEIHGMGQTSMEHSVVSPDGRVFCVRDAEGRLVAQSWFWRNQYTGCFDNIEIPDRIFELYEKEHPDVGRKGLTTDVLEVYKKAAGELMQEDARVYQELLENGIITKEQYDALLLGKVTIGLGFNNIADAIQADKTIHQETDRVGVKRTDRLPYLYTDASTQYTIAEREGTVKSEYENLYVHQDDVPVYDWTNMSSTVLLTMKRMEQATDRDNLAYVSERSDEENLPKSQRIINSIAREYGLEPNDTRVMATARIALIYSKDKDNKVKIGDLLSSPLKTGLTEEQKQKATAHIMHQVKKALKQIGVQDFEVDLSSLSEEQQQMLQSVMQEIEKENDERGER